MKKHEKSNIGINSMVKGPMRVIGSSNSSLCIMNKINSDLFILLIK